VLAVPIMVAKLLKSKRTDLFVDNKWVVLPPFFDLNGSNYF
jgi:hypothetical protein